MTETKTNTVSEKSETQETDNAYKVVSEDKWLIRECDLYKDEYKECTSFKGRFHQYFIFGESLDCNQWKKDYDNCCKWEGSGDIKAGEALINSEKHRRLQRLRSHYRNDIWEKRDSPPEDWSKPLPEWMAKRDENTLLAEKAKEFREGYVEEKSKTPCIIM